MGLLGPWAADEWATALSSYRKAWSGPCRFDGIRMPRRMAPSADVCDLSGPAFWRHGIGAAAGRGNGTLSVWVKERAAGPAAQGSRFPAAHRALGSFSYAIGFAQAHLAKK